MAFEFFEGRLVYSEDGRELAEVTFPEVAEAVVDIDHTFVDDALRGRGMASELMERVAVKLREDGKRARLTCSYARGWFEKHAEYADVAILREGADNG
ncbi:MAG: N-acetyltransferase [Oscillospiraceae bacterium]|jgi:predicted GNAT family acetyltransferase|nr:N-acetyltransferase [Oscillospiraceae bacterium]